jgi:P27 family predicted phage terminase small subunit
MRGRKPKPTLVKLLEGNPGKRPINDCEPRPCAAIPECPEFLDDEAKAEWFRSAKVLSDMGLLTVADRSALAAYCTAYSRWVNAEALVAKHGPVVLSPDKKFPMKSPYLVVADQAMEAMRKFMVEFGLTPSSRSRIKVIEGAEAADEFEEFLEAS